MIRSTFRATAGALLLALAAGHSHAQLADAEKYPNKPIRFVVAFAAGSATDTVARFVGAHITKVTGQPVVIENKPGGNGFLAASFVAKAPRDGYTALVTTQTTHAANPALFKRLPYDPVKDFTPIATVSKGATVLLARKDFPANNVRELTELAKKSPGSLTFASSSASARAGGELYKLLAGVDLLHVPYQSPSQIMTDIAGGRVDLTWSDGLNAMTNIRSGKMKALATTGAERMSSTPDIPTFAEQGLTDYQLYAWTAVYLPAQAPEAVARRLNELVREAIVSDPSYFRQSGSEPNPLTLEQFARFQEKEIALWARIVKAAGMEQE
ncbi:MAG: Bug family tripartite tricarboxylate transporter substrate binding protein [Hydrogenophaga sp.]|uniref:Bug family tripartite tricarboxylate transporter substrate binding protein n=1 Tax=Hydrogenophaga sp. TaxID=1904254 RepID=UPI0040367285